MPLSGIAVMLGGILMCIAFPVAGTEGSLFVRRGGSPVRESSGNMLVGGGLVCTLGTPERVVGTLPCAGDSLLGRRYAPGQFVAPSPKLIGARTCELSTSGGAARKLGWPRSGRHLDLAIEQRYCSQPPNSD